MENVKDLLRTADALFTEMNKNSGDWDELRRRIMPRMEGKARQQERGVKYDGYKKGMLTVIEHLKTAFPDRKSTRLNSSHASKSRMPSSA